MKLDELNAKCNQRKDQPPGGRRIEDHGALARGDVQWLAAADERRKRKPIEIVLGRLRIEIKV